MFFIYGHKFVSKAVVGGMKRDGQAYRHGKVRQFINSRHYPGGGDGDMPCAHIPHFRGIEDGNCLEQGLSVEEWFTHPHKDHVGDV